MFMVMLPSTTVWLIEVILRILGTVEVSAAKQSKINHTLCTLLFIRLVDSKKNIVISPHV